MRLVQWNDSYKIGHELIDGQHRKLVGMIASLQQSLGEGIEDEVASQTLKGLVDYTQYHFRDEERVMREIGHPEIEQHKYQHRQLLDQVVEILTDLRNGKDFDAHDLTEFLQHWLVDHIIAEDCKISRTMKAATKAGARR